MITFHPFHPFHPFRHHPGLGLVPALGLVLTAFSWAVIASTNLWPLLFGIYWKRTSPRATFLSMVAGTLTALLWQGFRTRLPEPWSGVHGFITGTLVALVVIEGRKKVVARYFRRHGYVRIERYEPFDKINRYFRRTPR